MTRRPRRGQVTRITAVSPCSTAAETTVDIARTGARHVTAKTGGYKPILPSIRFHERVQAGVARYPGRFAGVGRYILAGWGA